MISFTESKAVKKANELGTKATEKDIKDIDSKLPSMKKGVIAKVWNKVLFLWEQAKSPDIPLRLKIVIIGSLLYLILPADILPDAIPGIGLIDDLAVIMFVVKEVSKVALPKVEEKFENKFYGISYQKIDKKLSSIFSSILFTTLITFIINTIGCIILVLKPFGKINSRYVSIAVFVMDFIYSLIRFIIYLKDYGLLTKKIVSSVYSKRSISEGIADFVCTEYKYIDYIFHGLKIVKSLIPELKDIPDASQIVTVFKKHYRNWIILFISLFFIYSVLIMLTKFFLLKI